jgi:D-serine deaminase-like pyridoxal phosphate-dependent protein
LTPPFAVVDLDALDSNGESMITRANGLPIRLATKSIRCRAITNRALRHSALRQAQGAYSQAQDSGLKAPGAYTHGGFEGVLAYSLAEAIWLARSGISDVLLAYPTVDRSALADLANDDQLRESIMIMVDSVKHCELIANMAVAGQPIKICMDVDASLRVGPLHLGARRSPVHTPAQAYALAAEITKRPQLSLTGLMFYDAQIAGLPDSSAAVRVVKNLSARELLQRRAEVVEAVRKFADLKLINGGGTGSLHIVSQDHHLTELAGGSGLYGPTLFDHYRSFRPTPAAFFVSPVVRKPSPRHAVVYSGGYIASGPPGWSRQPLPWMPRDLGLLRTEGAEEVQTPLRGAAAATLQVGDQVWFRHAKAGELCERFDLLHLVQGDQIVDEVPTYRGEGRNFG